MSSFRSFWSGVVLLSASCATPSVRRVDVPPPTSHPGHELRRFEPQMRQLPGSRAAESGAPGSEASDRWLSEQIEQKIEEDRREEEARANAEAHRQAVERAAERQAYEYGDAYGPYHRPGYGFFPWNTLFYGGLGAVIGHQSGHRDEGLAIGAGVGLLFDTFRANHW